MFWVPGPGFSSSDWSPPATPTRHLAQGTPVSEVAQFCLSPIVEANIARRSKAPSLWSRGVGAASQIAGNLKRMVKKYSQECFFGGIFLGGVTLLALAIFAGLMHGGALGTPSAFRALADWSGKAKVSVGALGLVLAGASFFLYRYLNGGTAQQRARARQWEAFAQKLNQPKEELNT